MNKEVVKFRPGFYPVVHFVLYMIFLSVVYYYTRFLPFFLFGLMALLPFIIINMPCWIMVLTGESISFKVPAVFTFIHKRWSYRWEDIGSVSLIDAMSLDNFSARHKGHIVFQLKDGTTHKHGLGLMTRWHKNRLLDELRKHVEISRVDLRGIL